MIGPFLSLRLSNAKFKLQTFRARSMTVARVRRREPVSVRDDIPMTRAERVVVGFIYLECGEGEYSLNQPTTTTTMSPTVASATQNFVNSVAAIFSSLVHSVLAVFQAIFALGKEIISAVVQLVQEVVSLGMQVTGGALHFVTANFFVLAILGGGYYFYTQKQQGRSVGPKRMQ